MHSGIGCNVATEPVMDSTLVGAVLSGSMEPTLPGPRLRGVCQQQAHSFVFSDSGWDRRMQLRCPRCGSEASVSSEAEPSPLVPLEQIRDPKDVQLDSFVAFDRDGRLEIKRVVGLPNQRVTIRNGEIWIEDRLHPKDWETFLRQAILVDAARWVSGHDENGRWIEAQDGWHVYHHRSFWPIQANRFELHATAVHDECVFNPSESKTLSVVDDLGCIAFLPKNTRSIRLQLTGRYGNQTWMMEFVRSMGEARVRWMEPKRSAEFTVPLHASGAYVAVATFDQQWWVATDRECFRLGSLGFDPQLDFNNTSIQLSPEQPFAIRVAEGSLEQLWVIRDNYWHATDGREQQEFMAEDGYVVLGDNNVLSCDSREFGRIAQSSLRYVVRPTEPALGSLLRQLEFLGQPPRLSEASYRGPHDSP